MNSDMLLRHVNDFTEAPGGIERLRRFVVDLAILGKLESKDANIISGAELLTQIQIERQKLAKGNVVEKSKPQLSVEEDEIPVQGATSALFVRLAEIARIEKGITGIQSAKPGPYPLIGLAEELATCEEYQFDAKAAIVPLISSSGHGHASIKRLHYQEGKFALGNILCAVIPYAPEIISARFLYEYFFAYRESLFVSKMIGTANVSLTLGKIGEAPVPIVTPESQQRVDDLMKLCDELEVAQAKQERRCNRLVSATLHGLNNGAKDDEQGEYLSFEESARFYFNHLPRLTARPEHIQQLRRAILNLAVRGKLVPQDPKDEPAMELIKRISAEKERLVKDGKVRKQAIKTAIEKEGIPFRIPDNWRWGRLGEVGFVVSGYSFSSEDFNNHGGTRVIKITNAGVGCFVETEDYLPKNYRALYPNFLVFEGDLILALTRPYISDGLKISRCPNKYHEALLNQRVASIRTIPPMDQDYTYIYLRTQMVLNGYKARFEGKGLQPNLKIGDVASLLLPIPPLLEQRRIVAKVDELMKLFDELEARITKSITTRRQLLEATLQEHYLHQCNLFNLTIGHRVNR